MNIAFFSEAGYIGKAERNNPNMRTDQAWVCALNATHFPIYNLPNLKFDIGIVIIPKSTGGITGAAKQLYDRDNLAKHNYPLIKNIKQICDKVLVLQESTHWDWQEDTVEIMAWYYTQILDSDGILCHNDIDVPYFKGISNKPAYVLPTLMIEDTIQISHEVQDKVFVAGNWHTTYRGFDAWIIGREFDLPMTGFKSGKFKKGEEISGVEYLPWMQWNQFMFELSKCKYGVQTYQASAGQFPLNCAYLGIPCIGYDDINTQRMLHPKLSVRRGNIEQARILVNKLINDKEFYDSVSTESKQLYKDLYHEDKFLINWNNIIQQL